MEDIYNILVSNLIMERSVAHILHLRSQSYAEHMALGDLYDALNEHIDIIAEHIQGMKKELLNLNNIKAIKLMDGNSFALDRLKEFEKYILGVIDNIRDESLNNLLQELIKDVRSAIYKLSFLH